MLNKFVLGLMAAAFSPWIAAQPTTDVHLPPSNGYNQDSRGSAIRSDYGLCWRSGNWTPDDAVVGCDGTLAPPIANPIAPEIASNQIAAAQSTAHCTISITLESDQIFAFNDALLNSAAKKRINREVLPHLTDCKATQSITITGYSDNIGSPQTNQKLSEKRAAAVGNYLAKNGVTVQMQIHGAGDTQPLKICDAKLERTKLIACEAPNRRVSIRTQPLQPQ